MFKKIGLIFMGFITVFVGVVFMQSSAFKISRSATFNVPVADIFQKVNNFHHWKDWSPWAKLDPHATETFEGPAEGVGAKFTWNGNKDVGSGSMTIIESKTHELISIRLLFLKPFKATNTTEFRFETKNHQTTVTWTMTGENNFIGKAMSLVMDCDNMIGNEFEKGLENLRTLTA